MPSTDIRPYSTVRFKDADGTLLWQTSDAAGIYLSALDEKTPAVKTITVNVPARDGVLDLTESVAGRPLYGNRKIDMTISITASDHPAAVAAVRAMRRAIHGVMCRVETPDNILPGNPPVQGWYVGRVSIGAVTYPGEAAVVKLTVDAQPWIYYGTETVTLEAGTPTTYANGDGLDGTTAYTLMDIVVTQPVDSTYNTTERLTYAGKVPSLVAIVASPNDNLHVYGKTVAWRGFSKPSGGSWTEDAPGTWWVDDGNGKVRAAAPSGTALTTSFRLVAVCPPGTNRVQDLGMMVTDSTAKVGVYVNCPGNDGTMEAFAQGGTLPILTDGLLDGSSFDRRTVSPGTRIEWFDPADLVPTGMEGLPQGYMVAGVEMTAYDITGRVSTFGIMSGAGTEAAWSDAAGALNGFRLATPLYSSGSLANALRINAFGASELVELDVTGGTTAVYVGESTVRLDDPWWLAVGATHLRAYGFSEYGMKPLQLDLYEWPLQTAQVDVGDMPTRIDLTTTCPVQLVIDGKTVNMPTSGIITKQIDDELSYRIFGDDDATLAYDKGTV